MHRDLTQTKLKICFDVKKMYQILSLNLYMKNRTLQADLVRIKFLYHKILLNLNIAALVA